MRKLNLTLILGLLVVMMGLLLPMEAQAQTLKMDLRDSDAVLQFLPERQSVCGKHRISDRYTSGRSSGSDSVGYRSVRDWRRRQY